MGERSGVISRKCPAKILAEAIIIGLTTLQCVKPDGKISTRNGGFSLGLLKQSAMCGHLAAVISFCRYFDEDVELQQLLDGKISAVNMLELELNDFRSVYQLPEDHWCSATAKDIIASENGTTGLQHQLYDCLIEKDVTAFVEDETVGSVEKARRGALQGTEAGAFLLATPKGDCKFLSKHFQTACLLRLGLPQPFIEPGTKCSCGGVIDAYGHHLARCNRGGERTERHDAIVRTLRQLACRAGIKCSYNPVGCFSNPSTNSDGEVITFGNLRPDLRLFMGGSVVGLKEDNRDVVADVRITDSTGPSQIGKGIPRAEKEKIGKYGLASDANGLVFAPLVIEMLGQFSEKTNHFVNSLVHTLWEKEPELFPESVLLRYWRKRLSSVLQRYNALSLMARYQRATPATNGTDCVFDESRNDNIVAMCNV